VVVEVEVEVKKQIPGRFLEHLALLLLPLVLIEILLYLNLRNPILLISAQPTTRFLFAFYKLIGALKNWNS
jgi:hypothetical protein